ncbi:MAG: helix-turn-helix transcriptional regulator [Nitrospirae bacterium]|nr:helix-turn-helix transcriptional regulator [Magnetococcales bacterium]
MNIFGERLREERKRLKLNQSQFAALGGVQVRAQIHYEKDERRPDADYLIAIAAAGADVTYIITGVRSGTPSVPTLTREEECLLDNYRHAPEDQKAIIQATTAAFAQSNLVRKTGKKAG